MACQFPTQPPPAAIYQALGRGDGGERKADGSRASEGRKYLFREKAGQAGGHRIEPVLYSCLKQRAVGDDVVIEGDS